MNFNDQGIEGFDVSFYQDDPATVRQIDFAQMKAYGANFVIIRAGQNQWIDSDFVYNWREAKNAGLPRGAYWFYDPRISPQVQAAYFCNLVKDDIPEGRLWVDLEFPASYGGAYSAQTHWKTFCEEIKRLSGLRVGIYTGYYWWMEHTGNLSASDKSYWSQYALWLAWYTTNQANVIIPAPWTSVVMWQDGTPTIGIEVGVESNEIDHNKFNGGYSEFAQEFNSTIIIPPPPPIETTPLYVLKTKDIVAVFDKPQGTKTGAKIQKGVIFESDSRQAQWFRLMDGNWVSAGANGQYITILQDNSGDNPPPPPQTTDFCYVLPDYDQQWPIWEGGKFHVSRPTKNLGTAFRNTFGLPATARLAGLQKDTPMTKDIQLWIHGLCRAGVPSMSDAIAANAFASLFRDNAYATNYAGTTTRADYINGTNLGAGLPMLMGVTCGGTLLKRVGEKNIGVVPHWAVETIDATKDYRSFNPVDHPHLFYQPVTSRREKIMVENNHGDLVWSGKWEEWHAIEFSQYDGYAIVPILTNGVSIAYIPKWRVKVLAPGECAPSPFR